MADVDEVLRRIETDPAFRAQLLEAPAAALAGLDLDDAALRAVERAVLGASPHVTDGDDVRQWFAAPEG